MLVRPYRYLSRRGPFVSSAAMARVLVVEDDAAIRQLYVEVLTELGHDVAEAPTATEALHEVRRKRPALVLLDLMLPGGANGYDVLAEIRGSPRTAKLPVIAISGTSTGAYSLRAGADAYLRKPFEPDVLVDAVRRFV